MDLSDLSPDKVDDCNIGNQTVQQLTLSDFEKLSVIVGGSQFRVLGLLNMITLFVWSAHEKAQKFIELSGLQDAKIIEEPAEQIIAKARRLGFSEVLVDFEGVNDSDINEGLRIPL